MTSPSSDNAAPFPTTDQAIALPYKINRITIGVCRTQACLETREVPHEMFHFLPTPEGNWERTAFAS